ncbi:unnamed protein product [Mucor hiemalis]
MKDELDCDELDEKEVYALKKSYKPIVHRTILYNGIIRIDERTLLQHLGILHQNSPRILKEVVAELLSNGEEVLQIGVVEKDRNISRRKAVKKRKIQCDTEEEAFEEDDTEEEEEEARSIISKFDYLEGGEPEVGIDDSTHNWSIEGSNISEKFHDYRSYCIQKLARNQISPSYTEQLALNGIFWVDERNRRFYRLSPDTWNLVQSQIIKKFKDVTPPREYKEISHIAETTMNKGAEEGLIEASKYQVDCIQNGLNDEVMRANKTYGFTFALQNYEDEAIQPQYHQRATFLHSRG